MTAQLFLAALICSISPLTISLAQDFQLVETSPGSPAASLLRLFGALPGGGAGGVGVERKGREGGGKRAVYTLSMGHRIHVLSYDELTRQVRECEKEGTGLE
jgi:hypothetical protein